jgi:hypothetical protein
MQSHFSRENSIICYLRVPPNYKSHFPARHCASVLAVLFALVGYVFGRKYSKCEDRFRLSYSIMMLVGLGSFAFHATLRRYAQSMDELPMLWAAITLLYNSMDNAPKGFGTTQAGVPMTNARRIAAANQSFWMQVQYRLGLKLTLFVSGVVLTIIYFYLPGLFIVFFLGYSTFLLSFCIIMGIAIFCGPRRVRRGAEAVQVHQYEPVSTSAGVDGASAGSSGVEQTNGTHHQLKPYTPVLGKLFWVR